MNNIKTPKERVLFICTHNSARSQMAEGILKHLYGEKFEVYSAGTQVTSVNPLTIDVLAEVGIDILNYRSKSINEFKKMKFNYVITVCDSAKETCPFSIIYDCLNSFSKSLPSCVNKSNSSFSTKIFRLGMMKNNS